jgi:hypothetical protein
MILLKNSCFCIEAKRSGKGERFHWKPLTIGHWDSLSEVRYEKDSNYNVTHYLVPMTVSVFIGWFVIHLKMQKKQQSQQSMMRYEDTLNYAIGAGQPL